MGILMLRHTQPQVTPGICYGRTDLDVASSFEQDAALVLTQLPPIARIVSSPLQRCRKLADYLAASLGLKITTDDRLQEMDFGDWEGQAWDAIPRDQVEAWAADFFQARPHGGETVSMLKARIEDALNEIRELDQMTLLVTHAGVVRAAFASGTDPQHFQTDISFGGILRLPSKEEAHHE